MKMGDGNDGDIDDAGTERRRTPLSVTASGHADTSAAVRLAHPMPPSRPIPFRVAVEPHPRARRVPGAVTSSL
ncbi:hypothetical protein GCM10010360_60510 [Streptomyces nogalater]